MFLIDSVYMLLGRDDVFEESLLVTIAYKIDNINHGINFMLYCDINHGINFILYCVTGSVFRQTLVQLFMCHSKRISTRYVEEQVPTVQDNAAQFWNS